MHKAECGQDCVEVWRLSAGGSESQDRANNLHPLCVVDKRAMLKGQKHEFTFLFFSDHQNR